MRRHEIKSVTVVEYDVIDEEIIYADTKTVYNAILSEFSGHTRYWMPYFGVTLRRGNTPDEIGALMDMTVYSIPKIRFSVTTTEVEKNRMLRFQYVKGAFRGEGVWKFQNLEGITNIIFHWRANPSWLMLRLLGPLIDIPKSHSKVIQAGFKNLKKHLRVQTQSGEQ